MIVAIRISGLVDVPQAMEETLFRMRLRRKYSCVLLEETKENIAILARVRNLVAFGKISKEAIAELVEKRGQPIEKGTKIDAKKVADELGKKSLADFGLKPFFRLHPPIGGIESKVHFPVRKGVLGDHGDKIVNLLRRML